MAFLNFLTQGEPNKTNTSSLTTSQVPQYLSDYLYNLMSGSYAAAREEYQPYTGPGGKAIPRIAEFSPERTQAFLDTKDAADDYETQLKAATATAADAGALSPTTLANPYFTAANKTTPDVIKTYMDKYETNVTDRISEIAKRQLREKLMPELGDQFIRAGQFGSTRQQELAQRGVRDITENMTGQIAAELSKGYTTAGQQAQEDLRRQASLGQAAGQLAGTEMTGLSNLAGVQAGLAQKEQALGLQAAGALETIGMTKEQMNQRNLDLAYQDFQRQTQYPKEQLSFLSNIVRGLPSGGGTTSTQTTGSGQSYSASPLAQLASAGLGAASISKLLGG
jgi:hypothetical protein